MEELGILLKAILDKNVSTKEIKKAISQIEKESGTIKLSANTENVKKAVKEIGEFERLTAKQKEKHLQYEQTLRRNLLNLKTKEQEQSLNYEMKANKALIQSAAQEEKQIKAKILANEKNIAAAAKEEAQIRANIAANEKQLNIYKQMASLKLQNLEQKYGKEATKTQQFQETKNLVSSSSFSASNINEADIKIKQLASSLKQTMTDTRSFEELSSKEKAKHLEYEQKLRQNIKNIATKEQEKSLNYQMNTEKALLNQAAQEEKQIRTKLIAIEKATSQQLKQAEAEKRSTMEAEKQLQIYRQMASIKFQNLETKYGKSATKSPLMQEAKDFVSSDSFSTANIGDANVKIKQLDASLRDMKKSSKSIFGDLMHDFGKFSEFMVAGGIFMGITNKVMEGFTFIRDMSKEMTTLQMEMGRTDLSFKEIIGTTNNYASELGTTTGKVMEAVGVFTTYTSTIEEALDKTKSATIMSNISGESMAQSADNISAAMEQFDLKSEESLRVVDKIAGAARMLNVDYSKAVGEIGKGIGVVGSTAKEANVTLGETIGLIGTLIEKNRASGSQNANSLKTIFSRIGNVSEEINPEDWNQLEKTLTSVGVTIKNTTDGSITPAMTVLGQLAGKWETLTDIQRSNIAADVAGTYQRNKFLVLMSNWNDVLKNTKAAEESQGVTMQKQEIYANSLEASIMRLQAAFENIYIQMSDTDTLKQVLDAFTSLIEVIPGLMNLLNVIIPLKPALDLVLFAFTGLSNIIKELNVLLEESQGNYSSFLEKQLATRKAIEDETKAFQDQKDGMQKIQSEYESLSNASNLTSKEKERLLELQIQLVTQFGASATGINNEGKAYTDSSSAIRDRIKDIDELIKKKKEDIRLSSLESDEKNLKAMKAALAKKKEAEDLLFNKEPPKVVGGVGVEVGEKDPSKIYNSTGKLYSTKQLEAEIEGYQKEADKFSAIRKQTLDDHIRDIEDGGVKLSDTARKVASDYAGALSMQDKDLVTQEKNLKDFVQKLGDTGIAALVEQYEKYKKVGDTRGTDATAKTIQTRIKNMMDNMAAMKNSTISMDEPMKNFINNIDKAFGESSALNQAGDKKQRTDPFNFEVANKTLTESSKKMEVLRELYEKTSKVDFKSSNETLEYLLQNNLPELVGYLDNIPLLQQKINEKFAEQSQVAQDTYTNMILNNAEFTNTAIANNGGLVDEMSRLYGVDMNNYSTLAQSKLAIENSLLETLAGNWAQFYDAQGNLMTEAFEAAYENNGILQQQMSEALGSVIDPSSSLESFERGQRALSIMQTNKTQADKIESNIKSKFSEISNKFKGLVGNMQGSLANAGLAGSGGSGGNGGKSEPSKSAEIEADEKLILTDRYMSLNQALEQTNTLLAENNALQEIADQKTKVQLLEQETELLKLKQQNIHNITEEQRKERDELKSSLSDYGVTFDEAGNITNLDEATKYQAEKVNAHRSDKSKNTYKELKADYDNFEDVLKRFQVLQKEIPEQGIEWQKIQAEINKIEEEKINIKLEIRDEEFDKLSKKIEKRSKNIEEHNGKVNRVVVKNSVKQIDSIQTEINKLLEELTTETNPKLLEKINEELEQLIEKSREAVEKSKQLRVSFAEGIISRYQEKIDNKYTSKKSNIKDSLDLLSPDNYGQRKSSMSEIIDINKKSIEEMNGQLFIFGEMMKKAGTTEEKDVWKKKIEETTSAIHGLKVENKSFEDSIKSENAEKISKDMEKVSESFKEADYHISELEHKMEMLPEGADKTSITTEIVGELQKRITTTYDAIKKLKEQIETSSDPEFVKSASEQIKTLTSDIWSTESKIKSLTEPQLEKIKEMADKILDEEIENIKKRKDTEIKALEELIEKNKEASESKIKAIDDEINSLEKENDLFNEQAERLQKINELEKQNLIIGNLQKEKTIKIYEKGKGFVWSVDTKKLKEETDKQKEMQDDLAQWERELALSKRIDSLKASQEDIRQTQEQLEKLNEESIRLKEQQTEAEITALKTYQENYNKAINEDGVVKIQALTTLVNQLASVENASYTGRISQLNSFITDYNAKMASMNTSAGSNTLVSKQISATDFTSGYAQKTTTSGITSPTSVKISNMPQDVRKMPSTTGVFSKVTETPVNKPSPTFIPQNTVKNEITNVNVGVVKTNDASSFLNQMRRTGRSS